MHTLALEAVVALSRRRAAQGDCPTEPAAGVEMLENCVIDLANALDAARAISQASTAPHVPEEQVDLEQLCGFVTSVSHHVEGGIDAVTLYYIGGAKVTVQSTAPLSVVATPPRPHTPTIEAPLHAAIPAVPPHNQEPT